MGDIPSYTLKKVEAKSKGRVMENVFVYVRIGSQGVPVSDPGLSGNKLEDNIKNAGV
ncbi:hypothetical protein [Fictibacillus sp. NRS-1165]|uniref:hypothetical protein n=1 Tax=Fictibacillus sp. NRS-1165 TaxID=3144463 RepID=UPI003D1E0C66